MTTTIKLWATMSLLFANHAMDMILSFKNYLKSWGNQKSSPCPERLRQSSSLGLCHCKALQALNFEFQKWNPNWNIYIYSTYRYYRRYSGIIGKPIFYLKRVWARGKSHFK
jgi:hypothetical protein